MQSFLINISNTPSQPKQGLFVGASEAVEDIDGGLKEALLLLGVDDVIGDGEQHHRIVEEKLGDDGNRKWIVKKTETVDPFDSWRIKEVDN